VTPDRDRVGEDEKPEAQTTDLPVARPQNGLLFQIAVLLTVALIPVGMVAVDQTARSIDAVRETYLDALRARTTEVATPEREAILESLGIVRAVSDVVAVLELDAPECGELMERTAASNTHILFIGLIEASGVSDCNNTGMAHDFAGGAVSDIPFSAPRADLRFAAAGGATGRPVVILSEPVFDADGGFRGFISLTFPANRLDEADDWPGGVPGAKVILFNALGEILSASAPDAGRLLPADLALSELPSRSTTEFTAPSLSGELRDYALVPIAPGRVYALGSWPASLAAITGSPALAMTIAYPLAMWLVSMVVALVSIQYLVIRPIRDLGRRMRGFADGRRILDAGRLRTAPGEISEIGSTFETMARKIICDEADLENTLYEREVLLKEVHHRVKNNLQLMSSILSMEVRKARSDEARDALRDVQKRLRSLAAIHRGLYQVPELSRIDFEELLGELVEQLVSLAPERLAGGKPVLDLAEVRLVPDQAAPLAMLSAEMLTNALKYVGSDAEGRREVAVRLGKRDDPDGERIEVEVSNSLPPDCAGDWLEGLGRRLMNVLAQQLGGRIETDLAPDRYTVRISFLRDRFPADALIQA
jgi:two-component sensor histidine kinase